MANFQTPNVADQPPAKLIAQGLSLVKMENDSQQQMALQVPRNEERIYTAALKELELNPEHAAKSYYSIPHENRRTGKTELVEGPGIKAAMSLARRWGNCANSGRIVDEQEDFFIVQGVFLDYETNFRSLRDVMVQKKWKSREGKVGLLSIERLQNAIGAGVSKAVRNAILASLPVGLVDAHFKKAKSIAIEWGLGGSGNQKNKPIGERLKDAKAKFKKLGVPEDVMDKYIAAQIAENDGAWKDEDVLGHLIGVWNAIDDGASNIEDIFGIEAQTGPVMPAPKASSAPPPTTQPPTTTKPKDNLL